MSVLTGRAHFSIFVEKCAPAMYGILEIATCREQLKKISECISKDSQSK